MSQNKINHLRDHLFASIERLADPDCKVDIAREKQISEAARVIIESAKVEVLAVSETGRMLDSDFWKAPKAVPALGQSGREN